MLGLGAWGTRRVKHADDYAVARQSYGPVALALAFAATGASGATFLGLPGLAYSNGLSIMLYAICYPIGMYIGVYICLRVVSESGNEFGSRSIPEYLGDRYKSDRIRVIAAFDVSYPVFLPGGPTRSRPWSCSKLCWGWPRDLR